MARREWTIVIVPPDNAGARTYRVGERGRRVALGVVGAAALSVGAAFLVLFTPWATPSARVLLAENERLRAELGRIDVRLATLNDTIAALANRDQQIRLLAGLPTDSAASADASRIGAGGGRLADASAPQRNKPFFGRLSFGGRPDINGLIQRATELSASFRAVNDTLTRNFERLANTPSIMPTVGWLSSHFSQSRFHPVLHENRPHEGIDVTAPMGAPIVAPASGIVRSVNHNEPGYGNTLEIDHGNGIVTRFAHCSRIAVHEGQHVTRGQVVATVGNTGLSTGPHLHYEVHVKGKPVDPLTFVLPEKVAD
ncbi:MAG: M23 family metallopeptidase [Gemmatimonadetes bacterium]|nr:M23 family metallopeptidase [Gemmatimonadota bacterium]